MGYSNIVNHAMSTVAFPHTQNACKKKLVEFVDTVVYLLTGHVFVCETQGQT